MPPRITLITLGVADLARSDAFFRSVGFERSSASVDGEVSFFRAGGVVLGLFGRDDLAADASVPADGSGFRAFSVAMNFGSRAEVDEAFDRWVAAGAEPTAPPRPTDWGGYTSYVADPEGHLWEIAHNPGWPLSDDGRIELPD
jgi:predicted lactoylglutathione lyase